MGKKDRIKRSPSHFQTKLSLKELKEFVSITSSATVDEEEKESLNDEYEEISSSIRNQIIGLPDAPRPYTAELQARYDALQRRFDAMSDYELETTISALRHTQRAAKDPVGRTTAEFKGSNEEVLEGPVLDSISSMEGPSDEDQETTFGSIQDSCELAHKRKNELNVAGQKESIVDPIIVGLKEQVEDGPIQGPTSKWCADIQARIRSIRGRVASSSEFSANHSNAGAHEPSLFANFLMDVVQMEKIGTNHSCSHSMFTPTAPMQDEQVQAQQEFGGVRTEFNRKNNPNTEPKVFSVEEGQEHLKSIPNGNLPRTPMLENPKFTDKGPSINGGAFNTFFSPKGSNIGSHLEDTRLNERLVGSIRSALEAPVSTMDQAPCVESNPEPPTVSMVNHGANGLCTSDKDSSCPHATRDTSASDAFNAFNPSQRHNDGASDGTTDTCANMLIMNSGRGKADNDILAGFVRNGQMDTQYGFVKSNVELGGPIRTKQSAVLPSVCTRGSARNVMVTHPPAVGPTYYMDSNAAGQQPIGPIPMTPSHLEVHGDQTGSAFLVPNNADTARCHGGLSHPVGAPSHDINTKMVTDNGYRKRFTELFASPSGLAKQAVTDGEVPTRKDDVTTFDFPLGYVSHGSRSENLILKVPRDLTEEGSTDWVTTLVGYFIGKRLPYSLVSSTTDRLWADYGFFDTRATDSGVFFFTFSCEEKRDAVLEGGPWYVAGQPLILQPWKPSLRLDKTDVHSIPIWVNLYGIPLELWNPKGISFIASYIGKPLRVDRMTASRRRISYARVCVEVSGDVDLIEKFAIETEDGNGNNKLLDIDVEYQWKPARCSKCSTFGHDCHRAANPSPGHFAPNSRPYQSGHPTSLRNHYNMAKAGVWQIVQRKDKGKKIVEGPSLGVNPSGSTQRPEATSSGSSQEKQVSNSENYPFTAGGAASSYEHVVHSINVSPPTCETRISNVPINNSFNGLIPYVYDKEDDAHIEDCVGGSPHEDFPEKAETTTDFVSPMSARQRKREAKMLFSGSRPKGRHRS